MGAQVLPWGACEAAHQRSCAEQQTQGMTPQQALVCCHLCRSLAMLMGQQIWSHSLQQAHMCGSCVCSYAAASFLACWSVLSHNRRRATGALQRAEVVGLFHHKRACAFHVSCRAATPGRGLHRRPRANVDVCNEWCLLTSILAPAAGQQGHTTTPQELTLLEDIVAYGLQDEVPWPGTQASCSSSGRNSSSTQLRLAELLPFVHSSPGKGVPPVGPHSKPTIDPLVDALRQLQARLGHRESSVANST